MDPFRGQKSGAGCALMIWVRNLHASWQSGPAIFYKSRHTAYSWVVLETKQRGPALGCSGNTARKSGCLPMRCGNFESACAVRFDRWSGCWTRKMHDCQNCSSTSLAVTVPAAVLNGPASKIVAHRAFSITGQSKDLSVDASLQAVYCTTFR